MTTSKIYYKGDDIKEPIQAWSDDAKTVPIDIENDIIDIIIRIYTSPLDIKKFSKTSKTGYTQLIKETSEKYWLILPGDITKDMKAGNCIIDAMVIQLDSQMPDGRLNESAENIFFILKESSNKDEI
jgi:hypothetical protein